MGTAPRCLAPGTRAVSGTGGYGHGRRRPPDRECLAGYAEVEASAALASFRLSVVIVLQVGKALPRHSTERPGTSANSKGDKKEAEPNQCWLENWRVVHAESRRVAGA